MKPTIEELLESERELTKLAHHPKFISKQEVILRAVNTLGFVRLYLQDQTNTKKADF